MKLNFSNTSIGRFRLIGFLEAISFLLLLFIAMPLKYFAGIPEVVRFTGWIHGFLFILYIVSLLKVAFALRWSLIRVLIAFLASLVPAGPFFLDSQHRKEEEIILKQNN